jgi:hypothetical protein
MGFQSIRPESMTVFLLPSCALGSSPSLSMQANSLPTHPSTLANWIDGPIQRPFAKEHQSNGPSAATGGQSEIPMHRTFSPPAALGRIYPWECLPSPGWAIMISRGTQHPPTCLNGLLHGDVDGTLSCSASSRSFSGPPAPPGTPSPDTGDRLSKWAFWWLLLQGRRCRDGAC